MEDIGFEEQLQQENLQKEIDQEAVDVMQQGRTKTDPDGTVYEWDCEKKAWFPKIDEDFIAKYQMNYGQYAEKSDVGEEGPSRGEDRQGDASDHYSSCYQYYQQNYDGSAPDVHSQEYREWYTYYYGGGDSQADAPQTEGGTGSRGEAAVDPPLTAPTEPAFDPDALTGTERARYDEWVKYWQSCDYSLAESREKVAGAWHRETLGEAPGQDTPGGGTADDEDSKGNDKESKEKAAKRKAQEPPSWFQMDVEDTKNTSVYVSGLPTDITDLEFLELMNKCGLINYDPIIKKPKVKLYKMADGTNKGDALCSYIKAESVDLALQILDGYNMRENVVSVERAKFELKGSFDPAKRRRKLTNKEKKKIKEKQTKLFDWRPDKPQGTRPRHERVVVLHNVFHPQDFDTDPAAINEVRDDLRDECAKFGEVRKVMVYDRNPTGVATITFKEAEFADLCIEALHGRWFASRQLTASAWDGKQKFMVEESEEEKAVRLKKWEDFLAKGGKRPEGGGGGGESGAAGAAANPPSQPGAAPPTSTYRTGGAEDDQKEEEEEEEEEGDEEEEEEEGGRSKDPLRSDSQQGAGKGEGGGVVVTGGQ